MKIDTKQENALVVGAETKNFGVHLDPAVYVQMLTKWYSDSIGSVVRELSSNAKDANVEYEVNSTIVVGLTKDRFFVQDFGKGLSPDFMNNNIDVEVEGKIVKMGYLTLGHSTKKGCEKQLGFYGVGRVSPLAYTNQYWVHTVYERMAYEYLIFLDGNTIKQTLISETPTEEPSGTRVVVQLKKEWREFDKWREAIKQQCAYFEGTVIDIEGDRHIVVVGKEGFIRKSSLYQDNSHLVLGSVYYEIDWNHFKHWNVISNLNLGIYIGLDEGVIPTPSRESVKN